MSASVQVMTLVIAATAAACASVATWAAVSHRYWFWRVLAVWSCVALMIPIRAWEPALVLAIALPTIAVCIRSLQWLQHRRDAIAVNTFSAARVLRFGLRDLLLLTAL